MEPPAHQTEQDIRGDLDIARVDTFIELDTSGVVTLYAGKVELGTGIATALAQVVAGELGLDPHAIRVVMGDTGRSPDQGTTAGSKTLQIAGPVIRLAAARAREVLLQRASERLEVAPHDLMLVDGHARPVDSSGEGLPIGELATSPFGVEIGNVHAATLPEPTPLTGVSVPRIDLLGKLTGAPAYVHDLHLPGMLHGRVVRPMRRINDGIGVEIVDVDDRAARAMLGVVEIVRNGSFIGVVAEREEEAIRAAEALQVTWSDPETLMSIEQFHERLPELTAKTVELVRIGDPESTIAASEHAHRARYTFPLQAHASMGPSCAVADVKPDRATVWSSTQGPYALRDSIAPLLQLDPEQVRVIYREGAGCYGQNGADDVAADAALLSQAVGRPVRVQWMRQEEFAWEPKGAGMVVEIGAVQDADGAIVAWDYDVWTPTHAQRPSGQAGHLLAAQQIDTPAIPAPDPRYVGGDRNASTTYDIPESQTTVHWSRTAPLRVSSLRSLGGTHNTTATELFMDELARRAGVDPVAFRLRHLHDPRAMAVVARAAEASGWAAPLPETPGSLSGRGIAYSRYEGEYAYVASVAEVEVDPATGTVRVRRVVVAHDCGRIINPDGVRNQIEGQVVQGVSRALAEQVTWDDTTVTTLTWSEYPVPRFSDIPEVDIVLVDRPDAPSLGAGEPTICTIPPAVGNAIAAATGARMYDIPFTAERVLAALATTS